MNTSTTDTTTCSRHVQAIAVPQTVPAAMQIIAYRQLFATRNATESPSLFIITAMRSALRDLFHNR